MTEKSKAKKRGEVVGEIKVEDVAIQPSAPACSLVVDLVHGTIVSAHIKSAAADAALKAIATEKNLPIAENDGHLEAITTCLRGTVYKVFDFLVSCTKRPFTPGDKVVVGFGADPHDPQSFRRPLAVASTQECPDANFSHMLNAEAILT